MLHGKHLEESNKMGVVLVSTQSVYILKDFPCVSVRFEGYRFESPQLGVCGVDRSGDVLCLTLRLTLLETPVSFPAETYITNLSQILVHVNGEHYTSTAADI